MFILSIKIGVYYLIYFQRFGIFVKTKKLLFMNTLKPTFVLMLFLFCATLVFSCKSDDDSTPTEICNDGLDNDNDGFVDCQDNDCAEAANCAVEICDDGIDNDNDGFIDCDDNDCTEAANC